MAAEQELLGLRHALLRSLSAERMQIGQSLHDQALQGLYAIQLRLASHRRDGRPDEAPRLILELERHIDESVLALQRLCRQLYQPELRFCGLLGALDGAARDFRASHPDLDLRLDLPRSEPELGLEREGLILGAVVSCLGNVARHAQAERARVLLADEGATVRLEIADDGRGIDLPLDLSRLVEQGHFGIAQMTAHVELLGGRLDVSACPGEGTLVRIRIPKDPAGSIDAPALLGAGRELPR